MKQRNLHKQYTKRREGSNTCFQTHRAAEPSKFSLNLYFTPWDYALRQGCQISLLIKSAAYLRDMPVSEVHAADKGTFNILFPQLRILSLECGMPLEED